MNAMITPKVLDKGIAELKQKGKTCLFVEGFSLHIESEELSGKLTLTAQVFQGDGYLSDSVRLALSSHPFATFAALPTFLNVDEKRYAIFLHYRGLTNSLEKELPLTLELFITTAHQWREFLDERDREDFVRVPAR